MVACSGGGGGGSTPPPPAGGQHLHAYLGDLLSAGTLTLINPSAPTTPIPITGVPSLSFDFVPLFTGTLDFPAQVLRDVNLDAFVTGVGADVMEIPMGIPAAGTTPVARTVKTMSVNVEDTEATLDLSQTVRTVIYTVELAGGGYETFTDVGGTATPAVAFPGNPSPQHRIDPPAASAAGWLWTRAC